MVMNTPAPTIIVTFSAVACQAPKCRRNSPVSPPTIASRASSSTIQVYVPHGDAAIAAGGGGHAVGRERQRQHAADAPIELSSLAAGAHVPERDGWRCATDSADDAEEPSGRMERHAKGGVCRHR